MLGIGNAGLLGTWGVVEDRGREDKNDRGIVESPGGKGLSYNSKSDNNLMKKSALIRNYRRAHLKGV